ncbi:cytochrome P450 enzyme [Cyanobium sp. PCC 7001]|uniref:cytochrome P450 n=1 Tax=Cyanobium sp. PCC 7001 TaxID=180281 RepID=UPI0001805948|nr:cytochrome P450 [Cyanobium sp. PCC 7001]EDY39723.1 cytochrome P450 enzyme [Cyanobium sp. PCC 7001]
MPDGLKPLAQWPASAPRPLPRTGALSGVLEALAFFRDPGFAERRFDRFGNVFETVLLGQPLVFIRGSRALEDLLAQPEALEGWWPASVKQLLGPRSLANRNGHDHRARRRVVGQLFSAAALQRYTPAIKAQVDDLRDELLVSGGPVPLAARLRRFAFAVIAGVVLGLEGDDREALFQDFEIWTRGLFSFPVALPSSPFARALAARERLLGRLEQVLRRAREPGCSVSGGLDLLAGGVDEAGVPLSDPDLVEQLLLLLFAGYETTASSLSCLMLALLQHPAPRVWLLEEIDTLPWPPDGGSGTRAVGAPRLDVRLDAVVREVMRLVPPVGGFFRRTRQPLVLDGVAVPAGRVIQVALASSNRYGACGQESAPEAFRPERHCDGSWTSPLWPFGGGERVCLGKALAELEIRLLTIGLLRDVELDLLPNQDLGLAVIPSPMPRDGLLVRARRRSAEGTPEHGGGAGQHQGGGH